LPGADREERLRWAGQNIGRTVSSFKELSSAEAAHLIDLLKGAMGQYSPPRPRPSRERAHDMGTAGRRSAARDLLVMASQDDLALLQRDLDELGWDQARLTAFLAAPSSPLKHGSAIRTLADVNKVHWALKNILARERRKRGGDAA
jgi:hypothetical protein